ncbi:MAG: MoaD/ThiS family protein [Chloroflexi bacterium]|nr:MoaD/ThiS family protein [Chloroflexota bacterium]
MKINLKSNFDLGIYDMEFTEAGATLRDVLQALFRRDRGLDIISSANPTEVDPGFVVSVNGRDYMFLPQRLDTPLKEGDMVEVSVAAMGGG